MIRIWIPGPLPGMNDISAWCKIRYKKGTKYDSMKRKWTNYCKLAFQNAQIAPMEAVMIRFFWYEKNRRRDPDNVYAGCKFVIDGLVWAGVLENDGQKQVKAIYHETIQKAYAPGVKVCLYEWPTI